MFAIKSLLKTIPLSSSMMLLVSNIIIFAYAIRICERPLDRLGPSFYFENYGDSLWMLVLTVTTVGYGDYFPRTELGRLLTLITCLIGLANVSLMVFNITNVLTLSDSEKKVFNGRFDKSIDSDNYAKT
jgi:voltage-gated potassium channel Kch